MKYHLISPDKRYHSLRRFIKEYQKSKLRISSQESTLPSTLEVDSNKSEQKGESSSSKAKNNQVEQESTVAEPLTIAPNFDPDVDYWEKFFLPKSVKFFKQFPERSRLTPKYKLTWYSNIDLMEHYSISKLLILKISAPAIGILFILVLAAIVRYLEMSELVHPLEPWGWAILIFTSIVLCFGSAIYGHLYIKSINATFEGLRFNVTKGLYKRAYGSMTFRPYDVIDLTQDPLDFVLGIWRFEILGSNLPTDYFTYLPGLRTKDAFDLYRFVTYELKNQVGFTE